MQLEEKTEGARHRKSFLLAVVLTLVAGFTLLSPVLSTPFFGDDIHNSQRVAVLDSTGETFWTSTQNGTRQWMANEGRFFPVSVIENNIIFTKFTDRSSYKSLQFLTVIGVVVAIGTLAGLLTRNKKIGLLVTLLALPGLQFRYWYDPIHSFGLLLPSLALKTLGSWILALYGLRSTKKLSTLLSYTGAALLWTAGLLQYEIIYLLTPVVLILVWLENDATKNNRWAAIGTFFIPTFILGNYLATLRSAATPSPAYTTNYALEDFIPAFIYQTIGVIPGTASLFGATLPSPSKLLATATPLTLIGAIAGGIAARLLIRHLAIPSLKPVFCTAIIGGSLFVLPAIPIATSTRWQTELGWGYAYLPVFLQSLGFALLLCGLGILFFKTAKILTRSNPQWHTPTWLTPVASTTFGVVVGCLLLITSTGNQWVAEELQGFRIQQETTDAAFATGFLNQLNNEDALLISALPGGNSYLNAPYIAWKGGPSHLEILSSIPADASPCLPQRLCTSNSQPIYHLKEFLNTNGDHLFALAQVVARGPNETDPIVSLDNAQIFGASSTSVICSNSQHALSDPPNNWASTSCSGPPLPMSILVDLTAQNDFIDIESPTFKTANALIQSTFFDRLPLSATVVTETYSPFNNSYVAWQGGPNDIDFVFSIPENSVACGESQFCTADGRPLFLLKTSTRTPASPVLMLAPVATVLPQGQGGLILLDQVTLFGDRAATPHCNLRDLSLQSPTLTTGEWSIRQCAGDPTGEATFIQWLNQGCAAALESWPPCFTKED
ncbi:MAG: hypothetical protein HOI21_13135 [Bacteroidetes Order II. Incertae sedis bacterium]|nr:hypothetical protein [Bacteroidetes Order II. bacterium]